MVVAELGVAEKQPQESPPQAWPDEADGVGGEQPKSTPPRGGLSGTDRTFSCRAVIDSMHGQAGDAQRGRIFETVDAQEGGEHERQESNWKREGIGTGWSFSIFGGWGHETPGRRITCPRRTRVREKR